MTLKLNKLESLLPEDGNLKCGVCIFAVSLFLFYAAPRVGLLLPRSVVQSLVEIRSGEEDVNMNSL